MCTFDNWLVGTPIVGLSCYSMEYGHELPCLPLPTPLFQFTKLGDGEEVEIVVPSRLLLESILVLYTTICLMFFDTLYLAFGMDRVGVFYHCLIKIVHLCQDSSHT